MFNRSFNASFTLWTWWEDEESWPSRARMIDIKEERWHTSTHRHSLTIVLTRPSSYPSGSIIISWKEFIIPHVEGTSHHIEVMCHCFERVVHYVKYKCMLSHRENEAPWQENKLSLERTTHSIKKRIRCANGGRRHRTKRSERQKSHRIGTTVTIPT